MILTSPSGYRFKVIVNDEGQLSTEEIVIFGNIIASVSELSINEGENGTFTVSLSQVPTTDYVIIGMRNLVSDSWDGDIKNAPSMCELTVIKTTEA